MTWDCLDEAGKAISIPVEKTGGRVLALNETVLSELLEWRKTHPPLSDNRIIGVHPNTVQDITRRLRIKHQLGPEGLNATWLDVAVGL